MPNKIKTRQVLQNGQFKEVPESEVDYEFDSPSTIYNNTINLVPFQNAVQAARTFYSDKFINQSVPLVNGEAPYVSTLKDPSTNESFQHYLGLKTGVVSANDDDNDSTVTEITPNYIKLKSSKGKTYEKPLYNNQSFNRKTFVTNTPLVKVGDKVKSGQILAKTNYTDDNGDLAIGLNARVAVVPYKGWTYEDSLVVSQDFANRMASEQMYGFNQDKDSPDSGLKTGKTHYTALYPDKFNKEQLSNIDDNGVIKEGTIVHKGDPLILSTKARVISSNDAELGRLSKYLKNTRNDASIIWDHDADGEVTDVVKNKSGWVVNVKSKTPIVPGDKITTLNGNKCYHPDTEIFTKKGWKKIADVTLDDDVAALFDANRFLFESKDIYSVKRIKKNQKLYAKFVKPIATTAYHYNGVMCELNAAKAAYCVTPNHRIFSCANSRYTKDRSRWECRDAAEIHGMNRVFLPAAEFILNDRTVPTYIEIPYIPYKDPALNKDDNNQFKFDPYDFVVLLAFYLAEGNVKHSEFEKNKTIIITQKQRSFTDGLEKLFERMHFKYSYNKTAGQYHIFCQKSLATYLKQFGKANEKYIPDLIKELPIELIQLFLATYMQGDGDKALAKKVYTSSERMANDIAYLMILCGTTPSITMRDRKNQISNINQFGKEIIRNTIEYTITSIESSVVTTQKTYKQAYSLSSYDGMVYCCQVPGLGVILTRYKGKIIWNGNSTISQVIPMNQMPRTLDGKPVDIIFNPLAWPSRVNAAAMYSLMLGKVAEKTGKRYVLPSYNKSNESWYDMVEKELKDNNLSDVEPLYDPLEDRVLDNPVVVGNDYFVKLHHLGESKLSARSTGIYSGDLQPLKGGDEGAKSKRYSGLENAAIISSGAYNIIKDAIHLRGQKNDDYWRAVRMGETPHLSKSSPFVWDKYLAIMQGAGLNALERGNGVMQMSPFTDKQFERMLPVELENAHIVDLKDLKPVKGGLFDPAMSLTNKWGKITLTEPYPNPGFEDAIVSLLGIKKSDMYDIMKGEKSLSKYGTGNIAIRKALADIDMDSMLKDSKEEFKSGPKSSKQKALNRIRYIDGLQKNGLTPDELMISRIPVLPTKFRPYSIMGDTFLPGDANELYKDVFQMNQVQKELRDELGNDSMRENAMNMYNSIKALYGFGDSMNKKLQQRGVSGFMDKLVGGTSKFSYLNRAVNSKPVDMSGRSVIEMSPELTMDEIDLPNKIAYKIFAPYIQGELVKNGMKPKDAIKAIEEMDESTAGKALNAVMKKRPVWYSRAPSWHRYNVLSGWARRHEGNNILISPVVSTGLTADNDGDCQIAHIYVAIKK